MQWRRRRRVLVVVGAPHRALLLRGLQLVTADDDHRLEEAEQRWLQTPKVRAAREVIRRFQDADDETHHPDDGSEDEEGRDEERGGRERQWKPRPRFHQHHQGQGGYGYGAASGQEKRTFNEDEYTRITTPRQDVLFKKGYLGRKRTADAAGPPANGTNGYSNGSTSGDGSLHNGESVDAEHGEGSDLMDDQAYFYPGAFVEPASGMYYVNGGGYEMYDPYTGAVTVVVGPGPGMVGLPPMPLPPIEWFNPRLPPPPHGPHGPHGPPGVGPPHMGPPPDYCYMHGRKRYSLDSSQNCSGPSSESAGSGPPSGPPSSPQECESAGLPGGASPGPSPGPPPLPPMGPMPYPPHPYMYPYMFGAPLYSLDGVSVHGGPPYGPICDVNAVNKRRKKKRRRKRRRGGGTDDGSEESSSEDNQQEEGEGGPSSLSSQSVEEATPTDSDAAFPEFVPRTTSTLNGNASAWEPSILTPPQTPTAAVVAHQSLEAAAEATAAPADALPTLEAESAAGPADSLPTLEAECAAGPADSLPTPEEAESLADEARAAPADAPPAPDKCAVPEDAPPPAETLVQAVEAPQTPAAPAPAQAPRGPEEAPAPGEPGVAVEDVQPREPSPPPTSSSPTPTPSPDATSPALKAAQEPAKCVRKSAPKVNGEVICVSKKAVEERSPPLVNGKIKADAPSKEALEFESSLTLPVEKVPLCNGEVICFTEAVKSDSQTESSCLEISSNSGKDFSELRTEKETIEVILNNKNDLKQKGKPTQTKNAVNEGNVNGGSKIVNASNDKVKKIYKNNSSPDNRGSNGFAGKARLSASPSRDAAPDTVTARSPEEVESRSAQTKSEPVSKTKGPSAPAGPAGKRKASKKGAAAKTDLSSNAGGSNGVMAQTPPPPLPALEPPASAPDEGLSLSLRPESSLSWGRRSEEAKAPAVDDVLLQALVGAVPSAETKADIPVDSEPPAPASAPTPTPASVPASAPCPPRLELEAIEVEPKAEPKPVVKAETAAPAQPEALRLTPSSAHRPNRAKKWRQNTKDRAPTPGRELTTSSSSLSSSDEGDDVETVLFVSPQAASTAAASNEEGERVSPLRITEAVTAWLRDHEKEEVLVPAVAHVSDSEDTMDADEDEDDEEDEEEQQPKNALGNPFRASSHRSTNSATRAGPGPCTDVEERVASLDEPEPEAAWDTLCDPSLFVAKYYRLGEDPLVSSASLPPVLALELRPDVSPSGSRASPEKPGVRDHEQHDSGVHSDESGDEHQTPAKDAQSAQAQAEELAAKSAYLLRQLKGQSPGVPCGGICCTLQ